MRQKPYNELRTIEDQAMAKRTIKDINDNKKWFGRYTGFLAGDILRYIGDLERMRANQHVITPIGEEVRWTLVPIVSIFESFYKEIFAKYIDSGEPYLSRANNLQLKDKRLAISNLIEISKRNFTTGELIAYALSYNSFSQIRHNYEILVGKGYDDQIKDANLILDEQDKSEFERARPRILVILSNMETVFHLRHLIVHEYPATNAIVTIDEAITFHDDAWLLLMATDRLFWSDTGLKPPIRSI